MQSLDESEMREIAQQFKMSSTDLTVDRKVSEISGKSGTLGEIHKKISAKKGVNDDDDSVSGSDSDSDDSTEEAEARRQQATKKSTKMASSKSAANRRAMFKRSNAKVIVQEGAFESDEEIKSNE